MVVFIRWLSVMSRLTKKLETGVFQAMLWKLVSYRRVISLRAKGAMGYLHDAIKYSSSVSNE